MSNSAIIQSMAETYRKYHNTVSDKDILKKILALHLWFLTFVKVSAIRILANYKIKRNLWTDKNIIWYLVVMNDKTLANKDWQIDARLIIVRKAIVLFTDIS